jgi:hypothetical protein
VLKIVVKLLEEGETFEVLWGPQIVNLATHEEADERVLFEHIAFRDEFIPEFVDFRKLFPQISDMRQVVGWSIRIGQMNYIIFVDEVRGSAIELLQSLNEKGEMYLINLELANQPFIVDYAFELSPATLESLISRFSS